MTKTELYRAEAKAWRKIGRQADLGRYVHISEVVPFGGEVCMACTFRRIRHQPDSETLFSDPRDPARVIFCLLMALEAEDDARECA